MHQLIKHWFAGTGAADATDGVDAGRRDLLGVMPAGMLLGSGLAPAAADGRSRSSLDPIESSFIAFPDETSRFRAHMRFERDLRDQAEVTSWYHFTQYLVAPGYRPTPIIRFEGLEYSYFRRVGPQVWRVHGHNMSFPRDVHSGKFSDQATNPVTGASITVAPMFLTGDPGHLQSPQGFLPLERHEVRWTPLDALFRIEGDLVKMEQARPAPESWPKMFIESSCSFVPRREFDNARITSLLYQTAGFYIFPYPNWMNMGDRPGHMLGFWSGRKLRGVHELPVEFRARAQRERPDLLEAQWQVFDRPLPEALRAAVT